ncbi:MAG: cytochrome c3 family protein [bacterium]
MSQLERVRRAAWTRAVVGIAAAAMLVAGGCLGFGYDTGLHFSHGEHPDQIKDEPGYDRCVACHALDADGREYTRPSHQGATGCYGKDGGCHDVAVPIEEAKASPNRFCKECHTAETGEVIWKPHVFQDVKFRHADHTKNGVGEPIDCQRCHTLPIDNPKFGAVKRSVFTYPLSMEACMTCHAAEGAPSDCATCHEQRRPDVRPPSHRGAGWLESHGFEAERAAANCHWCHEGSRRLAFPESGLAATEFCVSCHTTMRPRSHVARWDQSLHGRFAQHDRRRCATCHEAEFCEACHAIPPRSHSFPRFQFPGDGHQRFARTNVRACLTCHEFGATCAACHER